MLAKFIQDNCLTVKGGFNNRCCLESWWTNRNFSSELQEIHDLTNQLDATIVNRCWHVVNDIYTIPACVVCNKPTKFKGFSEGYYRTCSQPCSTRDPLRNEKIRANTDHSSKSAKAKATNLERYGVSNFMASEAGKAQIARTKLERYGDPKFNNQAKIKRTNVERYGSEYWFSSEDGQRALTSRRKIHGGSFKILPDSAKLLNDFQFLLRENQNGKSIIEISEDIGVTCTAVTNKFIENGIEPIKYPSRKQVLQRKLTDKFKVYNPRCNDRKVLNPKELDIYFPERGLAVELNGLYWHSYNRLETTEERYRHWNKTKAANDLGISLIHITDREYLEKPDIIESIISNKLGSPQTAIRASKCDIREVSLSEEKAFLEANHIQGHSGSSIKLGLYHGDTLVYLMSFGKTRFDKKYEYELIRMCSLIGHRVHGAASKIFNYFIDEYQPSSVVSYCDLSKFSGGTYEQLGFTLDHISEPGYFYYKGNKIVSRYSSQKSNLKKILKSFDPELSESQNMFASGYRRYWNCGNGVYVYHKL